MKYNWKKCKICGEVFEEDDKLKHQSQKHFWYLGDIVDD